jgi:hypothetical protein
MPRSEQSSWGRPLCRRAARGVLMMSHASVSSKVPGPDSLVTSIELFQCRDASLSVSADLDDAVGG